MQRGPLNDRITHFNATPVSVPATLQRLSVFQSESLKAGFGFDVDHQVYFDNGTSIPALPLTFTIASVVYTVMRVRRGLGELNHSFAYLKGP